MGIVKSLKILVRNLSNSTQTALSECIFLFPHNCRRVRSGSGISVISSTSVDQRLPEEPVLEDEQQQLEKKLPGKAAFILS